MDSILGDFLQGLCDHPFHAFIGDRPRSSRPWLVHKPIQAHLGKALAPFAHRDPGQVKLSAISPLVRPSAARSTIQHFFAKAWALLGRRAWYSRVSRSCVESKTSGVGLPIRPMVPPSLQLEAKFAMEIFLPVFATQDTRNALV